MLPYAIQSIYTAIRAGDTNTLGIYLFMSLAVTILTGFTYTVKNKSCTKF